MGSWLRRLLGYGLVLMVCGGVPAAAQDVIIPTVAPNTGFSSYIRSDRLGITFINSAQIHASEQRYINALITGAGWNRYPVYWDKIETSPGVYDWAELSLIHI